MQKSTILILVGILLILADPLLTLIVKPDMLVVAILFPFLTLVGTLLLCGGLFFKIVLNKLEEE